MSANDKLLCELLDEVNSEVEDLRDDGVRCRSLFYRTLAERNTELSNILDVILSGSLQLDSSAAAGDYDYENHFLCARPRDQELPWDTTETD
ncbi:hypothetical protein BHYA_0049g00310 [Botrytis hyacinthi]|uniref:Uncharacterized protein n=1 Tax=Botrytis hyacinthi TaxID=278943 RepID=A0A4Z1GSE5_9HELO|nr:hypothetical protein BHYA_0049g00310 [Botrytis hyacinthi]